ncbi:uncharacterized protein LOC141527118 [Cotesia typhae]|uniref:uncharacterized protein LOC141527118 n=1 Tax=Cotesia typhae TaxID=2053667 RepID=UPI003D69FDEF
MSYINPRRVVSHLEHHLTDVPEPEAPISHLEIYLAKMLFQVIFDVANSVEFEVIPDTTLEFLESYETSAIQEPERAILPTSEEYIPEDPLSAPSTSRFDDPDLEYKRRAVEYWRNYKKGYKVRKTTRTLESVKEKFKRVKSISQLHAWKNYIDKGGSRFDKSKLIANMVLDKFRREAGVNTIIHDIDIQNWARKANEEVKLENFIASKTWLFNFKKNNNIVRRDVGKLIVRAEKEMVSLEQLSIVEQFRSMIQNERIFQIGRENVFNVAECMLNSTFSVILIISGGGRLLSPLTITVADQRKISRQEASHLESTISGLHIITGRLENQDPAEANRWFGKVFVNCAATRNCLIINHKLAMVKDIVVNAGLSDRMNVEVIPYGFEFMLEPLKAGSKIWIRFVKAINDYIDATEGCNFDRKRIDNIVKIQAFVHSQLTADRYSGLFADAWRKLGFLEARTPDQEPTDPVTFAFGRELRSNLCHICEDEAFLRCARCERFICFDHALVLLSPPGFHYL